MSQKKYTSSAPQPSLGRRGPMGNMGAPVQKAKDRKGTLKRLIRYFKAERKYVLMLGVAVVIGVAMGVIAPRFQANAIDRIRKPELGPLKTVLIWMLIAYVISGLSTLFQGFLSARLSQRVIRRLRGDLFRKIVNLPIAYIDNHSHGDIMSRMTNDAENISSIVSSSLSSLFSGVLTLIGTIAMMLSYSPLLTLLSCSTVLLTVLFTTTITKYMRKYFVKRQRLLGRLNGTVEETVTNTRTVTAYNRQGAEIRGFSETSDELTKTGIIAEIIGGSMGPVMNMLSNIAFVVVAVFGARFALSGEISVGVISAFIIYAKQFSRPINEIAQLYGQIQTAIAGGERIFEILDEPEEDKRGGDIVRPVRGVIEFRNVNFSYVPGKQVIKNFSLKVSSGKKIALVGSTGSGKTTIINLLMRFYPIDSGEILLDGKSIYDISTDELRNAIGIVLQDTVLFTDTVRNNLCYASHDITQAELDAAAVSSRCDDIIANLTDGYDTLLESSGANLSQGQRQLMTICRAFLSKPNILILDEATSSVDTRTEMDIQDAMTELMKQRTSLIIAHRLSTIQDADEIIVMDHGQIVESGSHAALLEKQGRYHELYMTQFAGQKT
ncbi:MAG: ABC transporter ATP-binding protein [Clostridia bacterium]|nr:ABC transporter ATP-binding protein [Clostridia bacterium]